MHREERQVFGNNVLNGNVTLVLQRRMCLCLGGQPPGAAALRLDEVHAPIEQGWHPPDCGEGRFPANRETRCVFARSGVLGTPSYRHRPGICFLRTIGHGGY